MSERHSTIEDSGFQLHISSVSFFLIGLGYILLLGTTIWSSALNRWLVVFPTFLFLFLGIIVLFAYTIIQYKTFLGKILSILITLGLGALWYMYWIAPEKFLCIDFPAANRIVGIFGIIFALLSIGITLSLVIKKKNIVHRLKSRHRKIIALTFFAFIFLGTSFSMNWYKPYYILVVPSESQAEPMQFSFWGFLNTSYYTEEQLYSLSNHSAIIIAYDWVYPYSSDIFGNIAGSEQNITRNDTLDWCEEIRDKYPGIKIMFPVFGGYYNYQNYLPTVNEYLEAIDERSLTNVIGFNFDLERHNDSCWHDAEALESAQLALFLCEFLIESEHPEYRIDNTGGIWMMYDNLPLGGSFELYKQHVLMSFTDWDHYAWQLYRGNAVDPASDPDSRDITERILSSVQYLGAEKTVPLFGTGVVGDYGPNNCSLDEGVDCNFAGFIRDCKIARALGVKEVQFYTLSYAGTYQGVYYPSLFEGFGDNFLDVLNESVNGLDEPETIVIPGNTAFTTSIGYWWENMSYSINYLNATFIISLPNILTKIIMIAKSKKEKRNKTNSV